MDLTGKRVAFTGRLASMTRIEAAALVRARGGEFAPGVSRRTALLVVGQDGWPLRKDGKLARSLETARVLGAAGHAIAIVREEDFLRELGVEGTSGGVHRRFTLAQLTRLLHIPRDRLRAWVREGWLGPVDTIDGVRYFDFEQVAGVRCLWNLIRSGVSTETIRRSLDKLGAWVGVEPAKLLEGGDRLLVRMEHGVVDASGQLHFEFDEASSPSAARLESRDPFTEGCDLEVAGRFNEAAQAYREALVQSPNAVVHFNLGNVLVRVGAYREAIGHFEQATAQAPDLHEAWNNLGLALAEMGRSEEAESAFRRALLIAPDYGDAHYNLADVLDEQGRRDQARPHWRAYLRLDSVGAWARHARARLQARG